jgi:putative ABC transport system substrate-binding protein
MVPAEQAHPADGAQGAPRLIRSVRRTGGGSSCGTDIGMTSRRAFLTALGGLLAWPRIAVAQQSERIYRVGWLSTAALRTEPYNLAFVDRLREVGFVEGRNLVIEFRSAQGGIDRLPKLASDLAQQNCDVFLSPGTERNLAAIKQASRDTPIVMVAIDYDPVATGHISSLARPGGRITGVSVHSKQT